MYSITTSNEHLYTVRYVIWLCKQTKRLEIFNMDLKNNFDSISMVTSRKLLGLTKKVKMAYLAVFFFFCIFAIQLTYLKYTSNEWAKLTASPLIDFYSRDFQFVKNLKRN